MGMKYRFPVTFRYREVRIESAWDEVFVQRSPVISVEDLVEWMHEPDFTEWEKAVLDVPFDGLQGLSVWTFLMQIWAREKNPRMLAQAAFQLGLSVRQKDRQGHQSRLLSRCFKELIKPATLRRAVERQRTLCYSAQLRRDMKACQHWTELFGRILATYPMSVQRDFERAEASEKQAIERETARYVYSILVYHEDQETIAFWETRLQEELDPDGTIFRETYADALYHFLHVVGTADIERVEQAETERLREENRVLREENAYLLGFLTQSSQAFSKVEKETPSGLPEKTLQGKRILVVGDEGHTVAYRAILERVGASMDFLPGFDKDRQLASKLSGADGMVFITAYASHLKFYAMKAAKTKETCVLVHQAGLGEFAKGVAELCERLSASA
jgi:hypothetical protein